eukprot:9627218-Alexandrium_andersonii.AAC.1
MCMRDSHHTVQPIDVLVADYDWRTEPMTAAAGLLDRHRQPSINTTHLCKHCACSDAQPCSARSRS